MSSLTCLPDLSLLAILGCIPLRNQLQLASMCRHWAFVLLPALGKSRRRLFLLLDDGCSHHQDRRALELITCSPNRVHNYHRLRDDTGRRPLRTLPGHMWVAPVSWSTLSFSMMLSQSTVSQLIGLFPGLKQLTISTATETVDAETVWRVVLVPFVGALNGSLRRLHLYGYYGFWEFTVPALDCATVSFSVAHKLFQALNGCSHLRDLTLELRNRYRLPPAGQATPQLDLPLLRQLDCFTYLNIAIVLSGNQVPDFPTRVGHDLLWPSILRHAVPGPRPHHINLRKANFVPTISEDCDLSPVYRRLPLSFTRRCLQANRFAQIHLLPTSFYTTFSRLVQVELLLMGRLPAFLAPLAQLHSLLSLSLLCFDFNNLHMNNANEEVERLVKRGQLPILRNLKSLHLQLGWTGNWPDNCFRGHGDFVDLPVAAFCPALQILELQVKHSATGLLKCKSCHLEEVSSAQLIAIAKTIAAGHRWLEVKSSVEERCTRQLLEPLLACAQMHTVLLSFVEMPHHRTSIRTSLRDTVEINWTDWREKGTLLRP